MSTVCQARLLFSGSCRQTSGAALIKGQAWINCTAVLRVITHILRFIPHPARTHNQHADVETLHCQPGAVDNSPIVATCIPAATSMLLSAVCASPNTADHQENHTRLVSTPCLLTKSSHKVGRLSSCNALALARDAPPTTVLPILCCAVAVPACRWVVTISTAGQCLLFVVRVQCPVPHHGVSQKTPNASGIAWRLHALFSARSVCFTSHRGTVCAYQTPAHHTP